MLYFLTNVVEKDSDRNDQEVLSLGIAALIGKAMNDQKVLDRLLGARGSKGELNREAKEACIEITDCDLDVLLKPIAGKLTIIDLLEIAKRCLSEHDPPGPPKWRD